MVGKAETEGYLLYGQTLLISKVGLGLNHDIVADPVAGIDACLLFDDGGKMLGSKAEQVSIETHFTAFAEMLYDSLVETDEEFLSVRERTILRAALTTVVLQERCQDVQQAFEYHLAALCLAFADTF